MVLDAKDNRELLTLLQEAALVVPDSFGIVWASRFLGRPLPDCYPGIELMLDVSRLCAQEGMPVYLLGGRELVAEKAARRLQSLCPGLRVAGCRHGYFSPKEEKALIQEIRLSKPKVLFVGMGCPQQELWIRKHLKALGVPVAVGVGGSMDVYAGEFKRAPRWMRKNGLEWSYRLLQEPLRLPRILRLSRFVTTVLSEKLSRTSRGFTLIELMIVVAVIGLLSTIALPKFGTLITRSRESSLQGNLSSFRSAIHIYYAGEGIYPNSLTELAINATYLASIPSGTVPAVAAQNNPGHDAGAGVAVGDGTSPTDVTLGNVWYYVNSGSNMGSLFVNCTHKDSVGNVWTVN